MWWNVRTSFDEHQFVTAENFDSRNPTMIKVKESKDLAVIRPIHQIHLSESAQFYGLILGPATMVLLQNDCILSFYNVDYSKPSIVQAVKDVAE